MKVTFLGTAAAEGVPAVFCNCDTCKKAKLLGGKNIRTRSQILVNDDLLIDFPMDSYFHMITNKLDFSNIQNIFITHSHMDHCYPMEFRTHGEPYAYNMTKPTLNIHSNSTVLSTIKQSLKDVIRPTARETLNFIELKPYINIQIDNYTITPIPAMHTIGENCFIYLIKDINDTTYLQYNDSGILPASVYDYFKNNNIKFDCISFDCTYGYFKKGPGRHMGLLDNLDEIERFKKIDAIKENTKFIITHFSHNGGLLHDEMQAKANEHNITVAYDGLQIEI